MSKYTIDHLDGRAKAATFETVHGTIHTPVFMNVATVAAIKGASKFRKLISVRKALRVALYRGVWP